MGLASIAEVQPSGQVVALANMSNLSRESYRFLPSPSETILEMYYAASPTNATGVWTPDATHLGPGPSHISGSGPALGTVAVSFVFHLRNDTANLTQVKFDVNETGWPWVNTNDRLGVELDTFAPLDSSFSFASSTSSLVESTTSGNSQEASLVLGASAAVASGGSGTLGVSTQAGIFSVGGQNDVAALLLTFSGPGGYAGLSYDPWVIFHPGPASVPVSPPLSLTTWVAIIAVVAIAVVMGAFGLYVRRKPIEEGLSPVADTDRRTRAWA
ncbi:MAG: hypothetical protein KGJ23_13930 [Euryarchaeota archaeon]|nr:hypothetical protein [Euryarchaeota archaeon]MDE2045973.1 hypothetical protein [Thermoplasmata archaeon]